MFSKVIYYVRNLNERYLEISFFLLALLIPTSISVLKLAIIIPFAALAYKTISSKNYIEKRRVEPILLLLFLFFVINALSILIHPPLKFTQLEKRISLLVFPLLFYSSQIVVTKELRTSVMKGFIIGNFLTALLNITNATYHSIRFEDGKFHFDSTIWGNISIWESIDHVGNYYFSVAFSNFIHPSYWALFLTMSIVFIWLENPFNSSRWVRFFSIGLFLFLIFLCSSRAGIFTAFITIVLLILNSVRHLASSAIRITLIGIVVLSIGLMFLNPRMLGLIRSIREGTFKEALRVGSWMSAYEIVKEHPAVGVGLQHSDRYLEIEYKRRGYTEHANLELNAHNQFLETTVATGIGGLIILLSIFSLAIWRAIRHRDILFSLLLFNLAFHFMVESMLNRLHGIVFFSFVFLILYLSSKPAGSENQ